MLSGDSKSPPGGLSPLRMNKKEHMLFICMTEKITLFFLQWNIHVNDCVSTASERGDRTDRPITWSEYLSGLLPWWSIQFVVKFYLLLNTKSLGTWFTSCWAQTYIHTEREIERVKGEVLLSPRHFIMKQLKFQKYWIIFYLSVLICVPGCV